MSKKGLDLQPTVELDEDTPPMDHQRSLQC